jgi:hypothetical protein
MPEWHASHVPLPAMIARQLLPAKVIAPRRGPDRAARHGRLDARREPKRLSLEERWVRAHLHRGQKFVDALAAPHFLRQV